MKPTKEQYEAERKFFIDYWDLRKRYYSAENEPESFWENLVRETDEMSRKYPGKYQRDLLIALIADIENRAREKKKR